MAAAPRAIGEMMEKFKHKHLSPEVMKRIKAAVQTAELKTQGEIVPMIVGRSSVIGHVPYYCFLLLLSSFLLMILGWEPWWAVEYHWFVISAALLVAFGLSQILARSWTVQRWLTPEADEELQVWRRAQSEWATRKMRDTKDRTGILLFVSVMERKAIVLADEGIARHYPPETWKEVVNLLGSHLHQGDWAQAFEQAIAKAGEILARHLPAQGRNPNEIHDDLIVQP